MKQRGGARFPEPTDNDATGFGTGFDARKQEWITALAASKFMPTAFTRSLRYDYDAATAAATVTDPSGSAPAPAVRGRGRPRAAAAATAPVPVVAPPALPDDAPTKEDVMTDYFAGIESDKIFTIALDLIRNKVLANLKAASPSAPAVDPSSNPMLDDKFIVANKAAINAMKDDMMLYMRDAERIVQLNTDTAYDKALGFTKLQLICGDSGGVSPSLSDFLLNPGRASDIFMIALANLYKAYVEKPEIVQNTEEYAHDCEVYTQTLALQMTGYRVRDGFYTNQGIRHFNDEFDTEIGGTFWKGFAESMKTTTSTVFTKDDSWGAIAAKIFQHHKANPSVDILSLFKNTCEKVDGLSQASLDALLGEGSIALQRYTEANTIYKGLPEGKGGRRASDADKAQATAKQVALNAVDVAKKELDKIRRKYANAQDQVRTYIPEPMYDDVSVRGTTLKSILCDIYPHQLQFIMRLSYAIKQIMAPAASP